MNSIGWLAFLLLFLWISFLQLKKWKRERVEREQILTKLNQLTEQEISFSPFDYFIEDRNFKRSNKIERRFRRRYLFDLLEEFNHQCFSCKRSMKTECDHFFLPKSKGGNLMLRHKEGYWVCNTILLCRACNSRKEDKSPEEFFSGDEIRECRKHLLRMSKIISEREC